MEGLDDLQVGDIELLVFRRVEVLFRDKDTLCNIKVRNRLQTTIDSKRTLEKVLVDNTPVLLRNDHAGPIGLFDTEAGNGAKMDFRDIS